MWITSNQANLSQKEVDEIVEELWTKEQANSKGKCHDCGVKAGKQHENGCDVARCTDCGGQHLSCDCADDENMDVWTGLWPGIKECYEQKLISKFGENGEWSFDLNSLKVIPKK